MNIVLGVSGGIAAYKAVALARLFAEAGHELHVVPTADALRFVGLPTWEAISRHPVTTSVHENVPEVRHVALAQRAELVVVAPATANTLARMTAGLADDLLGTTLLATRAPVLVAPAMHSEMWQHPATQHNVAVLRERGVRFVGPESGRLTGSDSGRGRMSEPHEIFEAARLILAEIADGDGTGEDRPGAAQTDDGAVEAAPPGTIEATDRAGIAADPVAQDLAGLRVLVTAGGTREPIDPVRYIGNRSSGRQGVAVARAALDRGAGVVLLAANIEEAVLAGLGEHPSLRVVPVGSAAELERTTRQAAAGADVIVMAAAVADYRVAEVSEGKIRKEDTGEAPPVLALVENPDILAGLVRERRTGQTIVGFAAETVSGDAGPAEAEAELLERGRRKLARKGADLLAVNAVGWAEGFETAHNTLHLLAAGGRLLARASGSKREAADTLLDAVLELRDAD